ncbi:MAG: helix-turn-helix transcriptional regulator [Actinomycetota bacterium]|nr:helix-turn-helix transcriptional regulator [Actinomycetota bacterium]
MNDLRTFGQAVREARLAKGMSMGQLAAAVERSTASVRRWERDQGMPTRAVAEELVRILGLEDTEFLSPTAAPSPTIPPPDVPAAPEPAETSDATRATAASATNTTPQAVPAPDGTSGWLAMLRDPEMPWLGYLRAALTVVVLLVMAWVLIWALGGFLNAFGDIWESLWADAP